MNLLFFGLEFVVVSVMLLGAVRLGRGSVIAVIGAMQFLQTILASSFYWQVGPDLVITPGSILFTSNLAILLYVYVRAGAEAARSIFYAIVGANLFIILMTPVLALHIEASPPLNLMGISPEIFDLGFTTPLFGVAIFAVSQLIALALFNTMRRRSFPVVIAMTLALVVALAFDTLGFVIPVFYDSPEFEAILVSSLASKAACGVVFGLTWGGLLQLRGAGECGPLRELFHELSYARKGGIAGVVSGRYDEDWGGASSLDAEQWFRSLPGGVCITVDGRIVVANRRFAALFGAESAERLEGDLASDWLPEAVVRKLVRGVEESGGQVAPRAHGLGSDKKIKVETSAFPFQIKGESAIVFVTSDVTEREALRDQLTHSGRLAAVGTLAAGLAHEVNNPLTMVIANQAVAMEILNELRNDLNDAPEIFQELEEIMRDANDGADRVKEIVAQLMNFSRLDSVEFEAIDPVELLNSVAKLARKHIDATARFVIELGPTPQIRGSAPRLSQVILNLLINASQALEGQPRDENEVKLSLTSEDDHIYIEVADTGPGIRPEVQHRVMEPFFTTKPLGKGTGLGLATSRSIVESHGGELSFETELGVGTTFRIVLPTS